MSAGLAIFVKTPGVSAVKTRLAAGQGKSYAEAWYLRAAVATASVLHGNVYWAVADDLTPAAKPWQGLPRIAQGEGCLGARMARVHAELVRRHGGGILVGADSPQMETELIDCAKDWLDDEDARGVVGPSEDGGFWLVGANRVLPLQDWKSVVYSRTDTYEHFRRQMSQHAAWLELATLTDVDEAKDLVALDRALGALAQPTAEQRALHHWMQWGHDNA